MAHWAFSAVCGLSLVVSPGRSPAAVLGLLLAEWSLVAHGLQAHGSVVAACEPSSVDLVVAVWLSCLVARGISPDQGSNPCPLHWQADS